MILFRRVAACAAFSLLTLCAFAAGAVPIRWTVSNGQFNGGQSFAGSFVYDADTNTYSEVNLTTTVPQVLTNATPLSSHVVLQATTSPGPDYTGSQVLVLTFNPALSDAGGPRVFSQNGVDSHGVEGTCMAADCSAAGGGHAIHSGILTGEVVQDTPTLAELALVAFGGLLALTGAFVLQRRWR
jgi:hypothetical protein